MRKSTEDDCLAVLGIGSIPHPDADVSGIGVVLAFLLSAYIAFAVVLLAYLTGFVDQDLLNPVDRHIFRIQPRSPKSWPRVSRCLRKAILALGDQQIVTGIAIMSAGFEGLRTGDISVYHYQIALYLAWMSSSVHLSALTILGATLTHNRGLMVWRISGMLVLFVLLLVALIPTISNDWGLQWWEGMESGHSGWGLPAHCFWGRLWGDGINLDSLLGFVLLSASYIWKIGALFPAVGLGYNRWIRHPIEDLAIRILSWTAGRYVARPSWYRLTAFRVAITGALPLFTLLAMIASFGASLWLSLLGLVFGTMQVVIPRKQNQWYTSTQESAWKFGQLVPLILLVQPLGIVSEHMWSGSDERDHQSDVEESNASRAFPDDSLGLGTAPRTLLSLLHCQNMSSYSERRQQTTALLYSSKVFTAGIYLINCAIIATAFLFYEVDAYSIGNDKVPKWKLAVMSIGASIGGMLLIVVVFIPFSRLGMSDDEGVNRKSWRVFFS